MPIPPNTGLTRREVDVGTLAADHYSDADIASILGISERTVRTHLTNARNKLGLTTRRDIARWFMDHK